MIDKIIMPYVKQQIADLQLRKKPGVAHYSRCLQRSVD